jgi:hypothetical protein
VEALKYRKLTAIPDAEGKTRIIGILDYWSQTALRPLHLYMNDVLAKLKEDCTFDQASFYSKLPSEGPFYSFDLSNATDRIPIELQLDIIG